MRHDVWMAPAVAMLSGVIAACKSPEPSGATYSFESDGILIEYAGVVSTEDGGEVTGSATNTSGRPMRGYLISTYVLGPSASFGIARGWIANMEPGQRYDFCASWTWAKIEEVLTCYRVLEGTTFGEPVVVQLQSGAIWMTRIPRAGERVAWRMEAVSNPETGYVDYRSIPSWVAHPDRVETGEVTEVDALRVRLDGDWVDWQNVVCWGTTLFPPN